MKHLFNDISSEEKNRILEMHKNAIFTERSTSLISEGRGGNGKTIWILEEDDMGVGKYFTKVVNLVEKNILGGEWKSRLINQTVVLDFYVNGTEVFSDNVIGPESDLLSLFGNTINGKFKITYNTSVHPEGKDTFKSNYEIHIMR